MWAVTVLPLNFSTLVLPVLAAYIFGVSTSACVQIDGRRCWLGPVFSLAAMACSFLPWYVALIFVYFFAGALFFFVAVWPALLYGKRRLKFTLLLFILSLVTASPLVITPLPVGLVVPAEVVQYLLLEDPLHTRLNWIRYLLEMVAYNVALRLTLKAMSRPRNVL